MAKFCSEGCNIVCDFCIHYKDEYEGTDDLFAGEGTCDINGKEVDASGGCDNFECFRLSK